MKWFDKWLHRKLRDAIEEPKHVSAKEKYALGIAAGTSINLVGQGIRLDREQRDLESHPDLNFRMFRAENGYVMEVRQYDKRTDRHSINMHIIPDSEDLGQSISHIITIESLKAK